MNKWDYIIFATFEIVALIVIVRLWTHRRFKVLARLIWSIVLLVPFFGLLAFVFLNNEPDTHADKIPDTYHTGSSSPGDAGGHSGSGHC